MCANVDLTAFHPVVALFGFGLGLCVLSVLFHPAAADAMSIQIYRPSRLTILTTENYYAAEIFFLPVFGLAVWLLGSAVVHLVLRLARKISDFDQILNILGMGMLIPMPVVLLWDWTMIALNWYQITVMAISHSFFALWGVILYTIGFKRILGLRLPVSVGLALVITVVYISLAMLFVR